MTAGAPNLADPEGWARRGAAFDFTAADAEAFARDHRAHLRRRKEKARGRAGRAVDQSVGLAAVAFMVAFAVAGFSLARGSYAEASENVAAGAVLGGGAASAALLLLALRVARRSYADPAWTLTTIRVGVDAGMLWIHKHGALTVFASRNAFVEVVRTDRFILAFVNKTSAHAFPPDRLAAGAEGRAVLDWFDANWPRRPDAEPAPDTVRRALHRELRRAWRIGWKAMVLLGALVLAVSLVEWAIDRRSAFLDRSMLPAPWGRGAADPVAHGPDR